LQNGYDASEFFVSVDALAIGAGAFTSDIEDVGTSIFHLFSAVDGGFDGEKRSAIGKAIWGYVQDAHNARAFTKVELSRSEAPGFCGLERWDTLMD